MRDFIYEIFFLFILLAEFPISNAKELHSNHDSLVELLKDWSNEFNPYKTDNESWKMTEIRRENESHLGALCFLRENWHCAKIGKDFKQNEQTECQKYRNYLDILYEYFFRVYIELPAVKPMFYFDKIYAFCTVTETINSLAIISKFYFVSEFGKENGHELETLFVRNYETKLFNENKLNYEENFEKETFQESVVKMGLELKWDNEIGKSHLNLIHPIIRTDFDKILEKMLKKAKKEWNGVAQLAANSTVGLSESDYWFLVTPLFLVSYNMRDDTPFIAFLRGQSNFEQICNEMHKDGKLGSITGYPNKTLEENKQYLTRMLEIYLGLFYLTRQNWHCDRMTEQSINDKKQKCEKLRNYIDHFYEYLFQIYAKTNVPMLAQQFPAVRPLFEYDNFVIEYVTLFKVVYSMHIDSQAFFGKSTSYKVSKLVLLNENELRNKKTNFGNLNETLRQKFDKKLNAMLKKVRDEDKMFKLEDMPEKKELLSKSPFYATIIKKIENAAFIAFVKGHNNFEYFCIKKDNTLLNFVNKKLIESATFEQKKKHLTQKYEAHLGVMYLMKKNWHCANIREELGEYEQRECLKYRKYLDILYEYLFSEYAEDDDVMKAINSQLLIQKIEKFGTIIDVVNTMKNVSKFFFNSEFRKTKKNKLENIFKNLFISLRRFEQIFKPEKENEEKTEGMLREKKQFDKKMEEMFKIAKEKVTEEAKELRKMEQQIEEQTVKDDSMKEELRKKRMAFDDKFDILFDWPFRGPLY